MKFFTKQETTVILIILLIISVVSFFNLRTSIRRQRDTQRKNDLGDVARMLDKYQNDYGEFPLATADGRIIACSQGLVLIPCDWGKPSDYLGLLPNDPQAGGGLKYIYISNTKRYQIYAHLEGRDEPEYDPKIIARKLSCGSLVCNFGRAFGKTVLDKPIEEYENEINTKY